MRRSLCQLILTGSQPILHELLGRRIFGRGRRPALLAPSRLRRELRPAVPAERDEPLRPEESRASATRQRPGCICRGGRATTRPGPQRALPSRPSAELADVVHLLGVVEVLQRQPGGCEYPALLEALEVRPAVLLSVQGGEPRAPSSSMIAMPSRSFFPDFSAATWEAVWRIFAASSALAAGAGSLVRSEERLVEPDQVHYQRHRVGARRCRSRS